MPEVAKTAPSLTWVIVPAYNEALVLPSVLEPVRAAGYEIVVVDDGSDDLTFKRAKSIGVHALRHRVNLGQGAALRTGMEYALSQGAELLVHFDADGQHRAEEIEKLIAPVVAGRADLAVGSRFLDSGGSLEAPLVKRVALRIGAVLNGLVTGVWLSDAHNGFRALSREAAQRIHLGQNGYAHATEIISEARANGLHIAEVSVRVRYTDYSKQKGQPLASAFSIVWDLLAGKLLR